MDQQLHRDHERDIAFGVEDDPIDFGDLPPAIDALLQRGVAAYRRDRREAEALFEQALEAAPDQLAVHFCLYKIHAYQGETDKALAAVEAGLSEAARQAGWSQDWRGWPESCATLEGPTRFAVYTLKALAFIRLRRDEPDEARRILDILSALDPAGAVGWPVVKALADAI